MSTPNKKNSKTPSSTSPFAKKASLQSSKSSSLNSYSTLGSNIWDQLDENDKVVDSLPIIPSSSRKGAYDDDFEWQMSSGCGKKSVANKIKEIKAEKYYQKQDMSLDYMDSDLNLAEGENDEYFEQAAFIEKDLAAQRRYKGFSDLDYEYGSRKNYYSTLIDDMVEDNIQKEENSSTLPKNQLVSQQQSVNNPSCDNKSSILVIMIGEKGSQRIHIQNSQKIEKVKIFLAEKLKIKINRLVLTRKDQYLPTYKTALELGFKSPEILAYEILDETKVAEKSTEAENPQDNEIEDGYIRLRFKLKSCPNYGEIKTKIEQKLNDVLTEYLDSINFSVDERNKISIIFDGDILDVNSTIEECDLFDEACVDVMF